MDHTLSNISGASVGFAAKKGISALLKELFSEATGIPTDVEDLAKGAKNVITFGLDKSRLQHAFKHAKDFGVQGNQSDKALREFSNTIQEFVNKPNIQVIQGTFRGTEKVTHFFEPTTNLWVSRDQFGNFVAGWRLYPSQVNDLIISGNIR